MRKGLTIISLFLMPQKFPYKLITFSFYCGNANIKNIFNWILTDSRKLVSIFQQLKEKQKMNIVHVCVHSQVLTRSQRSEILANVSCKIFEVCNE